MENGSAPPLFYRPDERGPIEYIANVLPRELPPGAIYYEAPEFAFGEPGPDGKHLIVILPDGHRWRVDGIAGNCTWKDRPHNCWSRTGTPPRVTVGKGPPCSDGAGSIKTPTYHGHLVDGVLTDNID